MRKRSRSANTDGGRARRRWDGCFRFSATKNRQIASRDVDPAVGGCQSYEATDFLLNGPIIDPSSQLILWQIGTLGDWTYVSNDRSARHQGPAGQPYRQ